MNAKDEFIDYTATTPNICAKKQGDAFLESRKNESVHFQYLCASPLFVLQHKVGKPPQVACIVCPLENIHIGRQR